MNMKKINGTMLRIVTEAEKLFATKGYNSTSMEDIMAASNASKGSIYHYFKNKNDLFIYILERQSMNWCDAWLTKETQYHSATEKLIGITEHYLWEFHSPLFTTIQEFAMSIHSEGNLDRVLDIYRKQYYEVYRRIFKEGIDSGEFIVEDPANYMHTFLGLHHGLEHAYYERISLDKLQELYLFATNIFLKGIRTSH